MPLEVRARTRIDDIDISRRPDGAVCVGGEAVDEDVLDAAGGQRLQEPLESRSLACFLRGLAEPLGKACELDETAPRLKSTNS